MFINRSIEQEDMQLFEIWEKIEGFVTGSEDGDVSGFGIFYKVKLFSHPRFLLKLKNFDVTCVFSHSLAHPNTLSFPQNSIVTCVQFIITQTNIDR